MDITQNTALADKLRTAYGVGNVDEVDLWVGGISEKPVPGGMVGPTFAKILKDQFERVRDGDRFWYENRIANDELSQFQIDMIENTLLSDIILRNTDIDMIQKNVFLSKDRREMWENRNAGGQPVGGTMIPIDTTALLLAGISTNYFIMMAFAILAALAFGFLYYTAQRNNKYEDPTSSTKFSYNNHTQH
jgi:hypothetical protein